MNWVIGKAMMYFFYEKVCYDFSDGTIFRKIYIDNKIRKEREKIKL